MKTNLLKNVLIASLVIVSASSAFAITSHNIQIDYYPYVGTLVSVAQAADSELTTEAAKACGSIQNVKRLNEVKITLPTISAYNVNPQNTDVGQTFTFSYPRVHATAVVICR
jgi:TRAP-type uncharacterized transport system substrate-binding protein